MTWVGLLRWAVGSPAAQDVLCEAAMHASLEAGKLGVLQAGVARTPELSALCRALDAHAIQVPADWPGEVKSRKTPTCAALRTRFEGRG